MDVAQQSPVLSVSRGHNHQWHVTVEGGRKPLATFDDPQAACAWAIDRAKPAQGRVFVEALAAEKNAPGAFAFSIPVTWSSSGNPRVNAARR